MVYWLEVKTMMLFQLTGKITDVFVSCKAVSKRKIAGDNSIKKKNNTQCLLFSLCQQGQSHFVMTVFCNTICYVDIFSSLPKIVCLIIMEVVIMA